MTDTVRATCANFGNCPLADGGEVVEVASLAAYPCANRAAGHPCGIQEPAAAKPQVLGGRLAVLGAALVALAVAAFAGLLAARPTEPSCRASEVAKLVDAPGLLARADACLTRARQERAPADARQASEGAVAALERAAAMAGPQQDRALQALGDVFSPTNRGDGGAFAGHGGCRRPIGRARDGRTRSAPTPRRPARPA